MIADFHIVGSLEDDIDQLKIRESQNEMTDDRCLHNVGVILSYLHSFLLVYKLVIVNLIIANPVGET